MRPLPHGRAALGNRLRRELAICSIAWRRIEQAQARRRKTIAMTEHRDWRQARRERTRLLIEYGGLVIKAGLDRLLEDDRATLLGALLSLRDQLTGSEAGEAGNPIPLILKQRWRRRGLRAFDADPRPQKGDRMENKSTMDTKPP